MNATARKTGNAGWTGPDGPMSRKLFSRAVALKEIAQRIVDHPAVVEDLHRQANMLIRESERLAEMETKLPVLVICPVRGSQRIN